MTQSPEPVVVVPREPTEAMVEAAAKAVERDRCLPYGWTDEQFEIWFNKDTAFVGRESTWGVNFSGTQKGKLFHEVKIALRHALAAAPASPDPLPPRCQRCGGEIHGWCCQSCPAEFREDDNGNLIFDEGSPDPLLEEAARIIEVVRVVTASDEIRELARAFLAKLRRA